MPSDARRACDLGFQECIKAHQVMRFDARKRSDLRKRGDANIASSDAVFASKRPVVGQGVSAGHRFRLAENRSSDNSVVGHP